MSQYQPLLPGSNRIALERWALLFFIFAIPVAHAVTIDAADKAIITNWLSTWKEPSKGFDLDFSTTVCADIIRLKDPERSAGLRCDPSGRVIYVNLQNPLWGSQMRDAFPARVWLPDTLGGLTQLQALRVRAVGLIGTIPSNLASLPLLTELNLGVNTLWGTVPVEFSTQKSNLEIFVLSDNLLSGQFPDLSAHKNLSVLGMSSNLFRCPQPYLKPSFFTVENFPSLPVNGCSAQINILADMSSPFSMCGEIANSSTRCNYFPQVYPNISIPEFPKFVAEPEGMAVRMDVSNGRSTFVFKNSTGSIVPDFRIQVEIHSITSYRAANIASAPLNDVYPFTEYHTMLSEKTSTGFKYRLLANVNGTRGKFESIWEFSFNGKIKFSFALADWDFPDADSGLSLEYQGNFVSPFADKNSPSACTLGPQDLIATFFQTGTFDIILLNCTGALSSFTSTTYKNDVELYPGLLQHLKFEKHSLTVEFPGEYIRDGVTDHFDPQSPTFFLWPFGRVPVMNFRNEPTFIDNAIIDQLIDSGVEQAGIINTRLLIKRFNEMLYDPLLLPTLFESPPGDPANESVNVAAIASGVVVAAVVAAVVLALIFVPRFRRAVLPYSVARARANTARRESTNLDLELTQQETPTSTPPGRWTIAGRPTSYQPDDL